MIENVKSLFKKTRNKIIMSLTDLMLERPNWAIVLILVNALIVLAFFLGAGSDVHTPLND